VGQIANLPLFWQVSNPPHVAIFLERAIVIVLRKAGPKIKKRALTGSCLVL
jgi:hypothetical protein